MWLDVSLPPPEEAWPNGPLNAAVELLGQLGAELGAYLRRVGGCVDESIRDRRREASPARYVPSVHVELGRRHLGDKFADGELLFALPWQCGNDGLENVLGHAGSPSEEH